MQKIRTVLRNDKSVMADEHFAAVEEAREESVLILRWEKHENGKI